MDRPQNTIAQMIATIRRYWLRRQLTCHISLAVAALFGWLLAMVVLDNTAMLSPRQLLFGWVVLILGLAAWTGILLYRLTIRCPDPQRLALLYEARGPLREDRLINAVQFLSSRASQHDPLACAVVLENSTTLDPQSAAQAVDFRPARRALAGLALCICLVLGYSILRPQWAANGLARVFNPLAPAAHLLATTPVVTPGDVELVEGAALTITAQVPLPAIGRRPDDVYLEYRVADLEWLDSPMMPVSEPSDADSTTGFEYRFESVRHPLVYRVRAGRSVSSTYSVAVQYRPRVRQLQVSVRRPRYAGGQVRELKPNVGDVVALEGSQVELSIKTSVPLSAGKIEGTGGQTTSGTPVPLEISGDDPRQASGGFTLTCSGSYAIRLTDTDGRSNLRSPRYTLTADPDQSPLAIISVPGRDLILPANAEIELTIEAEDDIGLAHLALQTRRGNFEWQTAETWRIAGRTTRRHVQKAPLALADLDLKVEDVLLYRVLARDHRRPAPNVGVGRTWSITVAEANEDQALLAQETRRLLEALQRILALQQENRTELDYDRAMEPIRSRQQQVRELTVELIDAERRSLRPTQSIIAELQDLADGLMVQCTQRLTEYAGPYQERIKQKKPLLDVMDAIIERLKALIGQVDRALDAARDAQAALDQLPPEEREQALKHIRDLLEKLRDFVPEQDKVIAETEELVRKGEDLTDEDLERIEKLKGTEDKWAEIFTDAVKDIMKLTEQGFADETIANDYKEMVEQIEAASLNLEPGLIELAVPREQAGRELAESLVEEMEQWLPNSPDHVQWIMEEPLDFPEIPMVDLPDQLWDLVGDLIEEQDALNDAAEDMTSAWADSIAEGAGWEVAGGPISNFSAVGKTGNQLPDNNELSGRSGDGRSGRSQGQLLENVAKGLAGRQTPTRVTNDPYEKGVVKELQQMATGGATGGGKARGAGQEGLQGLSPPPIMDQMQFMTDWQTRIRQKAERVAGQLKVIRISLPELDRAIELMKQAEQSGADGRYAELFKIQQMVLQNLRMTGELAPRELSLRVERAYHLPAEQRQRILDAMDEPVPQEYEDAVRRYFQQLSESE